MLLNHHNYQISPELRVVALFTAVTTKGKHEIILIDFCKPNAILRMVVASSDFGMGINVPEHYVLMNNKLLNFLIANVS